MDAKEGNSLRPSSTTRKRRFSVRLTNEEHESHHAVSKSVVSELGYSIAMPSNDEEEEDDICIWYISARSWQLGFAGDESPCATFEIRKNSEKEIAKVWKEFLGKELKEFKRCPPYLVICGCFDDVIAAQKCIDSAKSIIGFKSAAVVDARLAALSEHNKTSGLILHLDDSDTSAYMARYLGLFEGFRIAEGKCTLHDSSDAALRRDHLARVISCVIDAVALDCRTPLLRMLYVVGPAAERALGGHESHLLQELACTLGDRCHLVFPPHFKYCAWIGCSKVLCSLHQVVDALKGSATVQPSALVLSNNDGTLWNESSSEAQDKVTSSLDSITTRMHFESERDELLGLALAKLGLADSPTVSLLKKPVSTGPLWLPQWPKPQDSIISSAATVNSTTPENRQEKIAGLNKDEQIKTRDRAAIEKVSRTCVSATDDEISAAITENSDDLLGAINCCKEDRVFTCVQILRILQQTPSVKTRLAAIQILGQRCNNPEACREVVSLFRYDADKKSVERVFKDRSTKLKSASASQSSGKSSILRGGRNGGRVGGRSGGRGRSSAMAAKKSSTSLSTQHQGSSSTAETKQNYQSESAVQSPRSRAVEVISSTSTLATQDEISAALSQNSDNLLSAINSCKENRLFSCAQILRIIQETPSVKTRLTALGMLGPHCHDPEACREILDLFPYDADKKTVEKVFKDRSTKLKSALASKSGSKSSILRGGRSGGRFGGRGGGRGRPSAVVIRKTSTSHDSEKDQQSIGKTESKVIEEEKGAMQRQSSDQALRSTPFEIVSSACTMATEDEISAALFQHRKNVLLAIDTCKQDRVFSCAQIMRIIKETPSIKTRVAAIRTLGQRCSDPDTCRDIVDLFRFDSDKKTVEKVFKDRSTKLMSTSKSKLSANLSPLRSGRGGGRGGGRTLAVQTSQSKKSTTSASPATETNDDNSFNNRNELSRTQKDQNRSREKRVSFDLLARRASTEIVSSTSTMATEEEIKAALAENSSDLLNAVHACKGDRLFSCAQILWIIKETESVKSRIAAIRILGQRCNDPVACREIVDLFPYDADKQSVEEVFKDRSMKMKLLGGRRVSSKFSTQNLDATSGYLPAAKNGKAPPGDWEAAEVSQSNDELPSPIIAEIDERQLAPAAADRVHSPHRRSRAAPRLSTRKITESSSSVEPAYTVLDTYYVSSNPHLVYDDGLIDENDDDPYAVSISRGDAKDAPFKMQFIEHDDHQVDFDMEIDITNDDEEGEKSTSLRSTYDEKAQHTREDMFSWTSEPFLACLAPGDEIDEEAQQEAFLP